MAVTKCKTAVLVSGSGTNLQALMDAAKAPNYPAQIALVISNRADAFGLKRAESAGITALAIDHKAFGNREAFDRAMHAQLLHYGCEIVCLAGFMRLLSPWFVRQWEGRMLNIHPSLLPEFKGANAVRDALAANVKITGCTVHIVTETLDDGPILLQERLPVQPGDTEETLHRRIHAAEHRVYPAALRRLAEQVTARAPA